MKISAYAFLLTAATALFAEDTNQAAANFICEKEKQVNLNRLAVFTFTDADGEETDASTTQSTQFLSALASCEKLNIIDKSREEDVLEELAFEQTGIVDEKTMVPAGQLTGADSLLFGIVGTSGLELRLLDAKTGQLIAAQVFAADGATGQTTPLSDNDYYTKRWLVDSVRTQPPVYLYVTTTPAQWNILCARHPNLERYYNNLSPDQQKQLGAWRERVDHMRQENRLPQSHDRQFRRDAVRISHEHTRSPSMGRFRQNRFHTRTVGRQARRQGTGERGHARADHGQRGGGEHRGGQHNRGGGGHHGGHGGRR